MKKFLLFVGVLFCTLVMAVAAHAQVVGFVLNPQPIRGNYDIGIPASGWGISLDTVVATGRLVIGRSAGGAPSICIIRRAAKICPSSFYRDWETDRKSTRLNSSHLKLSRMPSSA